MLELPKFGRSLLIQRLLQMDSSISGSIEAASTAWETAFPESECDLPKTPPLGV
jgi:hypothetical protein